jgi:hypothetical protein
VLAVDPGMVVVLVDGQSISPGQYGRDLVPSTSGIACWICSVLGCI